MSANPIRKLLLCYLEEKWRPPWKSHVFVQIHKNWAGECHSPRYYRWIRLAANFSVSKIFRLICLGNFLPFYSLQNIDLHSFFLLSLTCWMLVLVALFGPFLEKGLASNNILNNELIDKQQCNKITKLFLLFRGPY